MPQLTLRPAVMGFCLGGLLSITSLYAAAKTVWTLGVGLTSVILAFALYRVFERLGARDMTFLENNCVQSIATAAGYMTLPLTSGLAGGVSLVSGEHYTRLLQEKWLGLQSSRHPPHSLDACYYPLVERGLARRGGARPGAGDTLRHIGLPRPVSWIGVPIVGAALVGIGDILVKVFVFG